jgi:hypothetical protein
MSNEFEITVKNLSYGNVITVCQKTGVNWDPMFGIPSIESVVLTPLEAEKLVQELNSAIRTARNANKGVP